MKSLPLKLLLGIFLTVLFLPVRTARANSLPPPTHIWISFFYPDNSIANIEAVQLIACKDQDCQSSVLIENWGQCNAPGCVTTPPVLSDILDLDCASNKCLLVYDTPFMIEGTVQVRLNVQVSGRALKSSEGLPLPIHQTRKWKVIIREENLFLEENTGFTFPDFAFRRFFETFTFSVVVELILAGIMIWLWNREKEVLSYKLLGAVLLANILSYPVAWLVIPAFGQLQYSSTREMGSLVAIGAGFFTLVSIGLSRRKPAEHREQPPPSATQPGEFWKGSKSRKPRKRFALLMVLQRNWAIILTILSIPVCGVCLGLGFLVSMFGHNKVFINGLRPYQVILLAEVFAVVFETWLVYILGKKALTLKQSAVMCLLANAASFLLGLVVLK